MKEKYFLFKKNNYSIKIFIIYKCLKHGKKIKKLGFVVIIFLLSKIHGYIESDDQRNIIYITRKLHILSTKKNKIK